jgi:predicted signal transduction protein with EAL and GGDEF domain
MQSMIDKTFAPGPRHAAARLGRGGAIVRRHLLGVINDILDFSKIESGHLELEAVRVLVVDDNQTFEGGESKAIVRAVLAMAKSVGMQVTAEGVESLEQALLLKPLGCDYLQGFRFSRPIREPAIPAIFSQHWPLELPPPLTIAQALVGQRTAETASPNPAYHNAVLTA